MGCPRAALLSLALALPAAPGSSAAAERATDTSEAEDSAAGAAGEEEAGSIDDTGAGARTLAERIPSVTRRAFVKAGRLEIFPSVGMSLNDPFYDHVIGTIGLSFHLLESLAIGVTGDYYMSLDSPVPVVAPGGVAPSAKVNRPLYAGRLEVTWAPFYGKLSLFAEDILHFDLYLIAGGGMLSRERDDATAAAVVGIGEHFFVNEWFGLRVELRDHIFMLGRSPRNPKRGQLQNLLSVVVGLSFYVPPSFEHEQL